MSASQSEAATVCGEASNTRKSLSTNSHFQFRLAATMPDSNETPKAIVIILIALAVLGALLAYANHIRPHP